MNSFQSPSFRFKKYFCQLYFQRIYSLISIYNNQLLLWLKSKSMALLHRRCSYHKLHIGIKTWIFIKTMYNSNRHRFVNITFQMNQFVTSIISSKVLLCVKSLLLIANNFLITTWDFFSKSHNFSNNSFNICWLYLIVYDFLSYLYEIMKNEYSRYITL